MARTKRFDQAHEATDKEIERIEREINREYKQAHKEVTDKLNDYLSQFAKKDEMWREWVDEGKVTQNDYISWRRGQILIGKRWQEMCDTLAEDYTNAAKIAMSITKGHAPEVYALNHNYSTFEIEKESGLDTSYTLYSRETVERMYRDNPKLYHNYGKAVAKEIKEGKQKAWDKKRVRSVLTQAVLQGESIPKIAKRLMIVTGGDRKAAIRNARTMMTGVENAGRIDSQKRASDLGIPIKKQWLATVDGRTRHWHRELDGVTAEIDEPFHNEMGDIMYPADPEAAPANVYNCRCTLISAIKGFEINVTDPSVRPMPKLKDMTYNEWKEAKKPTPKIVGGGSKYNASTVTAQYRNTAPMNEHEYWGTASNVKQRYDDIKELSGFDDEKTSAVLNAFCGDSKQWRGDYENTPQGWFYRADDRIRDWNNKEWEKQAKLIDDYIVAAPKFKGDIWRGMTLDQSVIDTFEVGGTFSETGRLSSWTSDRSVAQMFAEGRSEELNKTPVLIKTDDPEYGVPASHLSVFGNEENEVLVSNMHGSDYEITQINRDGGIVEVILKRRRK